MKEKLVMKRNRTRWIAHCLGALLACVSTLGYGESKLYFVHPDHLGTPQVMTDQAGQVVWQADYRPFGEVERESGTASQRMRFPGQYADGESGLYYNYYRDYDPSLGRYIQSDPIGLGGGLNTYAYAGGNPKLYIDSKGLAYGWAAGFGVRVIGGAAATAAIKKTLQKAVGATGGAVLACVLVGSCSISEENDPEAVEDEASETEENCDDVEYMDPNDIYPEDSLSDLDRDVVNDITEDMLKNGFDPNKPIDVYELAGKYYVADGHHRLRAAVKAGIQQVPVRK